MKGGAEKCLDPPWLDTIDRQGLPEVDPRRGVDVQNQERYFDYPPRNG